MIRMLLGGTIIHCAHGIDGNLTGKANMNPLLESRTYKVEFPYRRTAEFSANAIAEHMFMQCDVTGNQYLLLDSIINHKIEDSAVKDSDQHVEVNGQLHHKKTTTGVKVCAHWKNNVGTNS